MIAYTHPDPVLYIKGGCVVWMDYDARAIFPPYRFGSFGKARIEVVAGRLRHQTIRHLFSRLFDDAPMVGERRYAIVKTIGPETISSQTAPIRTEAEFTVRVCESIEGVALVSWSPSTDS